MWPVRLLPATPKGICRSGRGGPVYLLPPVAASPVGGTQRCRKAIESRMNRRFFAAILGIVVGAGLLVTNQCMIGSPSSLYMRHAWRRRTSCTRHICQGGQRYADLCPLLWVFGV